MKKWPNRRISRTCPYAQQAGEVAAEWARLHREFTAPQLYLEVFDRLNLRRVYLRKATVDVMVDGQMIMSWGGRVGDATEMLREYIIGACDGELRAQYPDKTPHFIDQDVGGRRSFLYIGAVADPKRVEHEALLYAGQELDLRAHREWRLLVAQAMRILSVDAEDAKQAVNSVQEVRENLLAGRPPGA